MGVVLVVRPPEQTPAISPIWRNPAGCHKNVLRISKELGSIFSTDWWPNKLTGLAMLTWLKDLASTATVTTKDNQQLLLITGIVLIVDVALMGIFLQWAYAEHYGMATSIFFSNRLFSTQDRSLIEDFGYVKEAAICLLLAGLYFRTRVMLYLAFSTLFLVLLLDDSLSFHEQFSALAASTLGPSFARYGEILAAALFGLVPLGMIGIGWLKAESADRRKGELLGIGVGLLLFFGLGVDFLHGVAQAKFPAAGGQTLASLVEDGGELISLSLILFVTLAVTEVFRPVARRAARAPRGAPAAGRSGR